MTSKVLFLHICFIFTSCGSVLPLLSPCESVCASSRLNVVLEAPTAAGSTTEVLLCTWAGFYLCICLLEDTLCHSDTTKTHLRWNHKTIQVYSWFKMNAKFEKSSEQRSWKYWGVNMQACLVFPCSVDAALSFRVLQEYGVKELMTVYYLPTKDLTNHTHLLCIHVQ